MSDVYQPTLTNAPIGITVSPVGGGGGAPPGTPGDAPGPLAPYKPPAPAAEAQPSEPHDPQPSDLEPGTPIAPYKPPEPKAPHRDIPTMEAASRGVINSLTFGFAPAIAGLAEASGMPSANPDPNEIDVNPVRPIVGAAKLLHSWLSDHPDPAVVDAYNRGRDAMRGEDEAAQEQHMAPFLAGQLIGALALPLGGSGAAATSLGRVGKTVLSSSIAGGGYEAGTETSKGGSVGDVAKAAGKGALTGGAFGAVGGTAAEALTSGAKKAASIVRGKFNVDKEASRRAAETIGEDYSKIAPMTPQEVNAAVEAGTPRVLADTGGGATPALARRAADTSPAAHQQLHEFAQQRFWDQNRRFAEWIRNKIGGKDTQGVLDDLALAARAANAPKYRRAYAIGDQKFPGGIWSPKLEQLMSSDALPEAAQRVMKTGKDRAVAEGMGGFNPQVTFNNGMLQVDRGKGVMAYPDLRFWDMIQRDLRDAASAAYKEGRNERGSAIKELRRQLVAELDAKVPEFEQARSTAARFFGATDAAEAGEKFVMKNVNLQEAARELAKLNPAERELFRVSFMSELADKIFNSSNSMDIINAAFVSSPAAKAKIVLAMGAQTANEFEALMRVEARVDLLRKALGNSQTSRFMSNLGHGVAHGGGAATAVGVFEAAKEGDISPYHIFFGAVLLGGARSAAHRIDARTAERVAEMLLSQNPKVLQQGVRLVASDPKLLNALRATTNAAARIGAHDVGPDAAAAGALTAAHNLATAGRIHGGEHHHSDQLDPIASQVDANQ